MTAEDIAEEAGHLSVLTTTDLAAVVGDSTLLATTIPAGGCLDRSAGAVGTWRLASADWGDAGRASPSTSTTVS